MAAQGTRTKQRGEAAHVAGREIRDGAEHGTKDGKHAAEPCTEGRGGCVTRGRMVKDRKKGKLAGVERWEEALPSKVAMAPMGKARDNVEERNPLSRAVTDARRDHYSGGDIANVLWELGEECLAPNFNAG